MISGINPILYKVFVPEFFISFISALLLTPLIGVIASKLKIVDSPGFMRKVEDVTRWRRIHTEPKLKLGGLAVIFPFLALTLIYTPYSKYLLGTLSGILVLIICGILDDFFDLSAKIQAIFHILAAIMVVVFGLEITIIKIPFIGVIDLQFWVLNYHGIIRAIPAMVITIIWIFFVINAVKWIAGSDGLVEGTSFITALILGLLSIRFQTYETAVMSFAFSGALLGFLFFNFYPSKIFSGSTGKSVYGFILAILAIYSGGKLATIILTLSLPILDAIWVIFYRIRVNKPKNLFELFSINDKSHIHHKLLELGFSQRQVALIEYLFTLCAGLLAFFLTGLYKVLAIFMITLIILLLYLFLSRALKRKSISSL